MVNPSDFKKLAGHVSHVEFAKYLRDLGWKTLQTKRNVVNVFQYQKESAFYQVDIPNDRSLSDYARAMCRAIEEVARFAEKSAEQVLLELINPMSDIVRIRLVNDELEAGSIYVEDAINLYENAKKLIAAAAMDVLSPKEHHRGRPDTKVQKFVSSCRFGQTEIGSYVVSVACPISIINDGDIKRLTLFEDKDEGSDSFTRKTVNKMITSIQAIKENIDSGSLREYLDKESISVNFLEALNLIGINKDKTQVDISVKWAPTVEANRTNFSTVSLTHDYSSPIETVIKKIKSNIIEEKMYIGKISNLDASSDIEKRTNGIVKLVFLNENNKPFTVKVKLSLEDYNQAIEAHSKGKYVRVLGTLSGKDMKCTEFSVEE